MNVYHYIMTSLILKINFKIKSISFVILLTFKICPSFFVFSCYYLLFIFLVIFEILIF